MYNKKINIDSRIDFNTAKEKLLSSVELTDDEKCIVSNVSLQVHQEDGMCPSNKPNAALHYLRVGLSAIRCINAALDKSHKKKPVQSILDFPCGYGRVLRFLKVRFPSADITVSEIESEALDFCSKEFSVKTLNSNKDFSKLSSPSKFDLIWCGSLFTHIDEKAAT